jgi:hypothetical protein
MAQAIGSMNCYFHSSIPISIPLFLFPFLYSYFHSSIPISIPLFLFPFLYSYFHSSYYSSKNLVSHENCNKYILLGVFITFSIFPFPPLTIWKRKIFRQYVFLLLLTESHTFKPCLQTT